MFEIRRYTAADKNAWDKYVSTARNATFLFRRDYMDYHADRFCDHSLLFYRNSRLHALLPAHLVGDVLCSHLGLTYGGLVVNFDVTIADVVELFKQLNPFLRTCGIKKVVYRPVPWIYHQHPSEEDLYAIFWQCGARLQSRNIGTTIFVQQRQPWRKDHRRRLRQAQDKGVRVERNGSIEAFWKVLEENLKQRFDAKPVHSLEEMLLLKSKFPDEIIQYNAYLNEEIIGGITFYLTPQVLHGQYSSTNALGKENGAMEAIYQQVMYEDFPHIPYLDFGSSTEAGGSIINEGLIAHKEGYGGRGVCYDTYEWTL